MYFSRSIATADRIPPSCLRVLFAVLAGRPDGRSLAIREISGRLGVSLNTVVPCLKRLQTHGLVAFEACKMRTIRATCRYEHLEGSQP